jgi:cytochrome c oxidase subunit 4
MADGTQTGSQHYHILPLRTYLFIGATLIVFTGITVAISFVHFGAYNLVVAMAIAAIKASLVALFFMHLKYDNKLYMIVFLGAILFLAIFIIFTMFDTMTRDSVEEIKGRPIQEQAQMYEEQQAAPAHGHGENTQEGAATDSAEVSTNPDSTLAKPEADH